MSEVFDKVFFIHADDGRLMGLQKYKRIPRKTKKKLSLEERKEIMDTMIGFNASVLTKDTRPFSQERSLGVYLWPKLNNE
jgi:hypothetical protein